MPNNLFHNLPQGWEVKTLGDILSSDKYAIKKGPFGSMLKKEFFVDSGIRVFEQYNPINQDSNWKRYFVTQQKFKELESFKAGAGDLLISCSGTLGKILELPKGVEVGIINQALLKIRLDDKQILNSYFVYLFNSPYMQKIILENTIGSAIQNIVSVKTLKQIQIPLPPLQTQQKIVAKLEGEFAKIESAKSHLEKVKETIPRLKNSLLKSAFIGELTHQKMTDSTSAIEIAPPNVESNTQTPNLAQIPSIAQNANIAQTPNFTQAPNLGGATLVAQNPQNGTNPLNCHLEHGEETHKESSCHSEALAEESQNIKPYKDSTLKDISATPQYDKTISICHSDLECNEREESQRYLANTQYEKDNNLPQDWEIKTLGEITNYGKTTQKCPKDLKPNDWILELEDIKKESGILLNKISFEERQSKSNKIIFYKGDVLFGTLRPYLKKVIIADDNGYCSSEIMPFNSGNEITNHYLAYLFLSDFMGNKIATLTYGTRMPRLGTKNGRELPISLPPLETQKQIVEILDFKFVALENLEKETNASLEKLQRLKSSLLNLAFKGELH